MGKLFIKYLEGNKKGEIIVSTIPKKGATARDKIRTLAVPQYISGIELDDTLPLFSRKLRAHL